MDESEEEPESFVQAYSIGNKGEKESQGSTTIGSNGDVRIKIRKNSMEPHSKVKANHNQLIQ